MNKEFNDEEINFIIDALSTYTNEFDIYCYDQKENLDIYNSIIKKIEILYKVGAI
ncbi:hypothetical protein [Macrococcoides bohemicum]|uniref:hypothetical protein n=1 Tax=Macrococcoides bohemicum TaxID=1903056 RepID=UPI0028A1950D|nr:hypothetical protein [Macrococcus bohemicus]